MHDIVVKVDKRAALKLGACGSGLLVPLEPGPMRLVVPPRLSFQLSGGQVLLVRARLVVESEEERLCVEPLKERRVVEDREARRRVGRRDCDGRV